MDHQFIFASLDSKKPTTARKVHIKRVYDILQLSIQRGDLSRGRKAWSILARCKEFDWKSMWTLGVYLVDVQDQSHMDPNPTRIAFLRALMLQHPDQREEILSELVLRLIQSQRHREALDELELYLPSFPYQNNPVLHVYAGMICLYLAQPTDDSSTESNSQSLRDAQVHFERAKSLDPDNPVSQEFLKQIASLRPSTGSSASPERDSEEEGIEVDAIGGQLSKRPKRHH